MPKTNVNMTQSKLRRFSDYVRGELRRRHEPQDRLADYLNMSRSSLTLRLNGKIEWTLKDFFNTLEYFKADINEII